MKLRLLRKQAGLTLKALAEKSGVHQVKIQQIEAGRLKLENITFRNALRLANALNCPAESLLAKESWC